jgi:Domain of unknown function (DUF4836)
MNSFLKHTLGLMAFALVISSCGKKAPEMTKHIPKDASYVVGFNMKQMQDKLVKEQLTFDNFISFLQGDKDSAYAKAKKFYDDIKSSGLDTEAPIYMYMNIDPADLQKMKGQVSFLFAVKDADKLEAYIKKNAAGAVIGKGDGFSHTAIPGTPNGSVGWSKEFAVAVIDLGGSSSRYDEIDYSSDSTVAPNLKNDGGDKNLTALSSIFKMKESESAADNSDFKELVAKNADMFIWTSSNSFSGIPGMPLPKLKDFLKNNYSATTVNFEEGKVVMDGDAIVNETLKTIFSKYAGPEVNMDLLENYPSSNVDGAVAVNFNPEIIMAFVKELGFEGLADMGLASQGITTADLTKAFKGEMAFAFSDFAVKQEPASWDSTYMMDKPSAKWMMNIKVGDKASFDKLMSVAMKNGAIEKQGDKYIVKGMGENDKTAISITGSNIVVTGDDATLGAYLAKSSKIGLADDVKKKFTGPTAMYFDISKILASVPTPKDTSDMLVMEKSKALFKEIWGNTSNYSSGKVHSHFELTLQDAKTNSLPQLAKYFQFAATEMKKKRDKQAAEYSDYNFPPTEEVGTSTAPAVMAPVEVVEEVKEVPARKK